MDDHRINDSTGSHVSALVRKIGISGDEASVVALLDEDHGEGGGVAWGILCGSLLQVGKLVLQDLSKLTFTDTIAEEEDAVGEHVGAGLEGIQLLLQHRTNLNDDLLTGILEADIGGIAGELDVHGANHGCNGGAFRVTW